MKKNYWYCEKCNALWTDSFLPDIHISLTNHKVYFVYLREHNPSRQVTEVVVKLDWKRRKN